MPPLVLKYQPTTFDEVIGQESIITILRKWVEAYKEGKFDFPNLLFSGSPGIGKTATARVLARALFGDEWKMSFRDLNASDDRGIDVIRTEVKSFARSAPLSGTLNLVFLDESDSLTSAAQDALRRVIEDCAGQTRFIFSCIE